MTKILLFGGSGMLGTALCHLLSQNHQITTPARRQFNILSPEWNKLSIKGYDYVINAAGLINRRAESNENFHIVNAIFPQALSALCARHNVRLIHFSTDCVFDGVHSPFFENSAKSAHDLYGKTKALGEPDLALVIRTSIIGPESSNHYNLLCWALSQKHINGFTNHLWNGITTLELARLIDQIISKSLYVEGVRHIFSEDCSKYELIASLCKIFSHDALITPVAAPEPRDTRLRTRFSEFHHALGIRPLEHQLKDLLAVAKPNGHWLKNSIKAA